LKLSGCAGGKHRRKPLQVGKCLTTQKKEKRGTQARRKGDIKPNNMEWKCRGKVIEP